MELRKDPVTQSWVIMADGELPESDGAACPLCPAHESTHLPTIYQDPSPGAWQVRVIPHLKPLYQIEGDAQRRGEGLYDKMRNLGAHEIVIETPEHKLRLDQFSDETMARILRAYASRVLDLKKDRRFRYVTVFRNSRSLAGRDLEHPHSQITATPFIPRRVHYELRSAQRHFQLKERCLMCDIVTQESANPLRMVEQDGQFAALCPFAPRVPYETWILPVSHHCSFEEDVTGWEAQLRLGRLLRSVLRRITAVAPAYHLVLHTSPNLSAKFERINNWQTLTEDYHWHFEVLPVIPSKSKSYSLKEVYYNTLLPEVAAQDLRQVSGS